MSARVWSLWTATFEHADRIAAHDRNELSALQMPQPAHRFQELPELEAGVLGMSSGGRDAKASGAAEVELLASGSSTCDR